MAPPRRWGERRIARAALVDAFLKLAVAAQLPGFKGAVALNTASASNVVASESTALHFRRSAGAVASIGQRTSGRSAFAHRSTSSGRSIREEHEDVSEIPPGRFLIATFPALRQVNYLLTPQSTWLSLVSSGLQAPEALCVDAINMRIYVADVSEAKVFWYQLQHSADGGLALNGGQHLALAGFSARSLAIDGAGNLLLAGRHLPEPPAQPSEGIYEMRSVALAPATGEADLDRVWPPGEDSSGEPLVSTGLAVDPFNVYWGRAPTSKSAVALERTMRAAPAHSAGSSVIAMADNVASVRAVSLTPAALLYSTTHSLHAVSRTKSGASCSDAGFGASLDLCPAIAVVQDATGLAFDGDGTVFIADHGAGAVLALASGSLPATAPSPTQVAESDGIWGLAVLPSASSCAARSMASEGAVIGAVLAASLGVFGALSPTRLLI